MQGRLLRITPLASYFFQAEDGIRDYKVTGVQTWLFRSVQLGKAQIEAANRGVGDEVLDEIGGVLILIFGTAPIIGTEHHRDCRGVEIVSERVIDAQRLFQVVQ